MFKLLSDVMIVVGVEISVVGIAVMTTALVTLECVVTALYAANVLGDVVNDICADVLADDLDFVLSSLLLEESWMFC